MSDAGPRSEVPGPRRSVLLVDDCDGVREAIASALASDYAVCSARNGDEALRACNIARFDVVITDLDMPVMGGVEFLHQIRRRGDETPVIVISGDDEAARLAREMGVVAVLVKPFEIDDLRAATEAAAAHMGRRPRRLSRGEVNMG